MNFTEILFYIFSTVLIASSIVVVSVNNMVYAIMFLILTFLNAAFLFILLNAEFVGIMLVVVYVGAIAVLFLFVIMMLNVDIKIKEKISKATPILICLSVAIFLEIFLVIKFSLIGDFTHSIDNKNNSELSNVQNIGNILYTKYFLAFEISGAILFVAMIGAIALTLHPETRFIRKQNISKQINRSKKNSIEIVKVKSNEGINI